MVESDLFNGPSAAESSQLLSFNKLGQLLPILGGCNNEPGTNGKHVFFVHRRLVWVKAERMKGSKHLFWWTDTTTDNNLMLI